MSCPRTQHIDSGELLFKGSSYLKDCTYLGDDIDSSRWTVLRLNETVGSVKCVSGTASGTDF